MHRQWPQAAAGRGMSSLPGIHAGAGFTSRLIVGGKMFLFPAMIPPMCSCFEMKAGREELVRRFALTEPPPLPAKGELRPTDGALTIGPGNRAMVLEWGIAASWNAKPLINARAETLAERKTFAPLLSNRCLVPATAYFEWRRAGKSKLRNRVTAAGGGLVALAGLVGEGRFTLVTCPPAPAIAHIHDRMPVILARRFEDRWLDEALPFAEVSGLLAPYGKSLEWQEEAPPQPDLFGPA